MRLAIADPPYLGMAARYYGGGRGYGRTITGSGIPDAHPAAARWDDPAEHVALVRHLTTSFDGWAIAMNTRSLQLYLVDVLVWHRGNSAPSGSSLHNQWEPVLIRRPPSRRARAHHGPVPDVLAAGTRKVGFVGHKPERWTRWVLAALWYTPDEDVVVDLFPGSGAVTTAIDGMLL